LFYKNAQEYLIKFGNEVRSSQKVTAVESIQGILD